MKEEKVTVSATWKKKVLRTN